MKKCCHVRGNVVPYGTRNDRKVDAMLGDLTRGPLRGIDTYHKETDLMEDDRPPEGVMWRTGVTVAVALGWLVWVLLWWAFWSGDYTVAQRFSVILVSIIALGAVTGVLWIPFNMRHGSEEDREQWSVPGFRWRVVGSMVVFLGLAGVLAWLLWEPWKDFTFCQSIVVIIVAVIVMAVILAPMWTKWGMRKSVSVEVNIGDEVGREVKEAVDEAMRDVKEKEDDD